MFEARDMPDIRVSGGKGPRDGTAKTLAAGKVESCRRKAQEDGSRGKLRRRRQQPSVQLRTVLCRLRRTNRVRTLEARGVPDTRVRGRQGSRGEAAKSWVAQEEEWRRTHLENPPGARARSSAPGTSATHSGEEQGATHHSSSSSRSSSSIRPRLSESLCRRGHCQGCPP